MVLTPIAAPVRAQHAFRGETDLRLKLAELNNLGSVMMIGAHPDDENNALLAYLARGRHVRTAYLSLTRGEGGQNLIGPEQGDELGIIRTQELLAEHRIDGSEQYFTRAIDFGFSKTAAETLTKWPREKILGDVVWNIRRFRPDVIILRFTGTPRDGHGHHQVSAILGKEAFSAAADPNRFPEQLKYVKPWQAMRLMTNLAAFNAEQEKEIAKIPDKLELDLGAYSPQLGMSWGEIAGWSRSLHRSQGQGSPERRGEIRNYFVTNAGDKPKKDLLEGVNLSWSRVNGGSPITAILDQAAQSLNPEHPEAELPLLAKARPLIASVAESSKDPLAERKLKELDETMAECSGLWADAQSDKFDVVPGASLKVTLTALDRLPDQITLTSARLTGMEGLPPSAVAPAVLQFNKASQYPVNVKVPDSEPYSQPYWLREPRQNSTYTVTDQQLVGNAEDAPVLSAEFKFKLAGVEITLVRPVQHRFTDRVQGELTRPLAVVPPVGVQFDGNAQVFANNQPRKIEVPVKANVAKVSGDVRLEIPAGWQVSPESQHFELMSVDEQRVLTFDLNPPAQDSQGTVTATATVGGKQISLNTRVIDYPHIPIQTLFPPAQVKVVRADIRILSHNIGYVMGAGDEIPESLRQLGCDVTMLSADDLTHGDLSRFDAIVTGVRSFNTRPDLRANYQRLFKYAEDGGTLVVQYNTPEGGPGGTVVDSPVLEHVGPYPIKTGRDRVTVEEAPVTFPNPQLALLHAPNEITPGDFEGWIQERGLNFASEWDPRYQSVLESHDPGEKPLQGGELYAKYGKGAYIFTCYDWFRELPGGVPGAFRLFANMLSAAKVQKP